MPPLLIGGAISAGGSILSGILGGNAASKAAEQQAAAGRAAASGQQAAGAQAQNDLAMAQRSETANEQPFISAGQGAVSNLANLLAPGGALQTPYASFSAPTAVTMQNDPGYQFQLSQGINALQNSAAARGGLLSTGTAKALNNYAQGTAAQNFSDVYNRALQTYNTNASNYYTGQNNQFSRLSSLAGLGENAAGSLNGILNSGSQAMANNLTGNAQVVGNDLMGVGNAQAAGTVGSANAYGGALTGATGAIGSGLTLSALLGAQNSSNNGATSGAFNVGNPYAGAGGNSGFIGGLSTYDSLGDSLQDEE